MELRGRILLAAFVVVLVLGMVGGAALAMESGVQAPPGPELAGDGNPVSLAAQVRILKQMDKMALTPEQMKQIISTLEVLKDEVTTNQQKIADLLMKEKSLLLAAEVDQDKVAEVEKLLGVAREEITLAWKSAKLEVSKVLRRDQLTALEALLPTPGGRFGPAHKFSEEKGVERKRGFVGSDPGPKTGPWGPEGKFQLKIETPHRMFIMNRDGLQFPMSQFRTKRGSAAGIDLLVSLLQQKLATLSN